MNKFELLQQKLTEMGWYVGWGLPCCQSCAWSCLPYEHEDGPFKGQDVDLDKVLFNHEQDCENYLEPPEDLDDDELDEWWDQQESSPILTSDECQSSLFCFSGSEQGVKNLVDILPVIEESGVDWSWNKEGTQRIELSWS